MTKLSEKFWLTQICTFKYKKFQLKNKHHLVFQPIEGQCRYPDPGLFSCITLNGFLSPLNWRFLRKQELVLGTRSPPSYAKPLLPKHIEPWHSSIQDLRETGEWSSAFQKIRGRTDRIKQHCPDRGDPAALLNADSESSSIWLENYSKHQGKTLISDRCWFTLPSILRVESLKTKFAFLIAMVLWVMGRPGSRLICV